MSMGQYLQNRRIQRSHDLLFVRIKCAYSISEEEGCLLWPSKASKNNGKEVKFVKVGYKINELTQCIP